MNTRNHYPKGILLLFIFSLIHVSCSNEPIYDSPVDNLSIEFDQNNRNNNPFKFNTRLSGAYSVPPVDTKATGQGIVTISKDETSIHYVLITANIKDVFAAHFHMAPTGVNGGVVATLYSNPNQPSGAANGVLAEGIITAANVVGALEGDLDALIDAIRAGNIYINVHSASVPSGEMRGQL